MAHLAVKSCLLGLALSGAASAALPASADNDACAFVQDQLFADREQELFYRTADGKWDRVPAEGLDLSTPTARLIYVVREFRLEAPRPGVVVIKTGRQIKAGEADPTPDGKPVRLNRPQQDALAGCGKPGEFNGRVSAQEYDRFHDYGYQASANKDGDALRDFHTSYAGRSRKCDATTDATAFDAPLFLDWRNNRSQFSFDREVVKGGPHSQIAAGLSISRAAAVGSVGLADQRVSIVAYKTNGLSIACIPVTVPLTGTRFFVRFNDLEGAKNQRRLIRADELERQLRR